MISVRRTHDLTLVRSVFTHESIWAHVNDDGSCAADDWRPAENDDLIYLAVRRDGDVIGCLLLVPINHALYELHSAMLPEGRGQGSRETAALMQAWLWANTPARKLMTWVPAYNVPAMAAAVKTGMTQAGRLTGAYLKNDVLHDLILYGVSKPCQ